MTTDVSSQPPSFTPTSSSRTTQTVLTIAIFVLVSLAIGVIILIYCYCRRRRSLQRYGDSISDGILAHSDEYIRAPENVDP